MKCSILKKFCLHLLHTFVLRDFKNVTFLVVNGNVQSRNQVANFFNCENKLH